MQSTEKSTAKQIHFWHGYPPIQMQSNCKCKFSYSNTFCCVVNVKLPVHCMPLTWEGTFDEVFKQLQVAVLQLSLYVYFSQQGVATAKLALQVLGTPEALELTVDHHCQSGTQGLTLLHTGEGTYQGDVSILTSSALHVSICSNTTSFN